MAFLAKFVATKYVGDKLEDNFGPEVREEISSAEPKPPPVLALLTMSPEPEVRHIRH
jgi:hypothetical protein